MPYTLLLRIEAMRFPTFGLLLYSRHATSARAWAEARTQGNIGRPAQSSAPAAVAPDA